MIELASRRELFLDHALIERLDGCSLKLHEPRDEGPVFLFDKPWDGMFSGYSTVIHHGDGYKLFYRGKPEFNDDGQGESVCVAESSDGKIWHRPELNLIEFGGNRRNNMVLREPYICHNFSPFLDTRSDIPESERYKGWGGSFYKNPGGGLIPLSSVDGIHWNKMRTHAVLTAGALDSQNVAFWSESEKCYLAYFRSFTIKNPTAENWGVEGIRTIYRATSKDFITWESVTPVSFDPPQEEEYYTNQMHPYFRAPHISIATAVRFFPGRRVLSDDEQRSLGVHPKYAAVAHDISDAVLLTSRGGLCVDRTFPEAWIRPGLSRSSWVSRCNYPALNVVQTGSDEMSVYVNADFAQPSAHLRRYSLRLDGFASLQAGHDVAEATTKPFSFSGSKLVINYATSAAGGILVELQDEGGKALSGYSLAECREIIGDEIERIVTWKSGEDLKMIAGRNVRLKFRMKEAELFSMQFCESFRFE